MSDSLQRDLLQRVEAEVGAFLRDPSHSPERRHRFVLVMEAAIGSYFQRAVQRNFEMNGLLTAFIRDVTVCTDRYEFADARALIQGARYTNTLISNALAGIPRGSDEEVAADVVMQEAGKDYMDLSTLITRLALENDIQL